jgi:hypothetical protein
MNHVFELELGPVIALAAILCAITVEFGVKRARLRRRTIQLQTANDLLKAHFRSLKEFVEHPAAPRKTKEKLLIFSKVISDRTKFLEILKQVCDEATFKNGNDQEAKNYEKDLTQLREQNSDLAKTFETTLTSGLAAMFLRYPDASNLLEATMARVYASPRKEFALFAGAVKKDRDNRDHTDIDMEPAVA